MRKDMEAVHARIACPERYRLRWFTFCVKGVALLIRSRRSPRRGLLMRKPRYPSPASYVACLRLIRRRRERRLFRGTCVFSASNTLAVTPLRARVRSLSTTSSFLTLFRENMLPIVACAQRYPKTLVVAECPASTKRPTTPRLARIRVSSGDGGHIELTMTSDGALQDWTLPWLSWGVSVPFYGDGFAARGMRSFGV